MTVRHIVEDSPIGALTLVADGDSLTGLYFAHHWSKPDPATFGPPGFSLLRIAEGTSWPDLADTHQVTYPSASTRHSEFDSLPAARGVVNTIV